MSAPRRLCLLSLLATLLPAARAQAEPTPPAPGAAGPLVRLWIEHGGNLESLANERIVVHPDGQVLLERGRPISRHDPKHGQVTDGVCERYEWRLTPAELEALRVTAARAQLGALAPSYRKPGVEDGSQAALLAQLGDQVVVSQFDNEFPPAYQAIREHLRTQTLDRPERHGKPRRCDLASWFFLRPPNDRR